MRALVCLSFLTMMSACEGEKGASETPAASSANTGGPAKSQATPNLLANVAATRSGDEDPWAVLPKTIKSLQDGALADQVTSLLDQRTSDRDVEEMQIRKAMTITVGQLATTCGGDAVNQSFEQLAQTEAASLQKDRETLGQILTVMGPEGRKLVWASDDARDALIASRQKMAKDLGNSLPNRMGAGESISDADVEMRRILVGLKFTIEAIALDSEAMVGATANDLKQMDPSADDTVVALTTAFTRVDDGLIMAQRTKFAKALETCAAVKPNTWLTLLETGSVGTFVGHLGGMSGVKTPQTSNTMNQAGRGANGGQASGIAQSGMQQGMSQSGAQQGQTGMQQGMGARTGQSGMQQSGQMGGMQQGGQMGGMQQGGMQQGGQMGQSGMQQGMGARTGQSGMQQGGQMGGQQGGQMGGQQGGQMGGGQMGGQMGGGQMGGGQMGGQMSGMQQGGQMGGR